MRPGSVAGPRGMVVDLLQSPARLPPVTGAVRLLRCAVRGLAETRDHSRFAEGRQPLRHSVSSPPAASSKATRSSWTAAMQTGRWFRPSA